MLAVSLGDKWLCEVRQDDAEALAMPQPGSSGNFTQQEGMSCEGS